MLEFMQKGEFDLVFSLMERSFPCGEYRPYSAQRALLDERDYRIRTMKRNGGIIGFAAVWEFERFTFLEHLAVDPQCRNSGIGGAILQELTDGCTSPLFLEGEMPETETAKRRIGFYERNGFYLNRYDYCQPALSAGNAPIPMYIMTAPAPIDPAQFGIMCREVYRRVYRTEYPA